MTARQLTTFRCLLEDKQAELEQRIRRTRERLAIGERGDELDVVQGTTDRESAANGAALDIRLLDGVREALREIRAGTFGRCAACDREIPLARLRAVPWSPYCIQCQEISEVRTGPLDGASEPYYAVAG